MRKIVLGAALALIASPALALGPIENACVRSSRQSASYALCGCIQDVADLMLSGTDQRLAASFFNDPGKAQKVRRSNSGNREAFWKRYKAFGTNAKIYCTN